MYRSTKKKVVKQASISAVVALGALATGIGIAGASPSTHHHDGTVLTSKDVATTTAPTPGDEFGHRPPGGTVTAATGTSITVSDSSGTTSTFAIDSSTTVSKDRTASTLAAVAVGDEVRIIPTAPGSTTAKFIDIEQPSVMGKVTAISGDTITLTGPSGTSRTVIVSSVTTYAKAGASATLADVTVGSSIFAQGTFASGSTTTLDATTVGIGFGPASHDGMGPDRGQGVTGLDRGQGGRGGPDWATPSASLTTPRA